MKQINQSIDWQDFTWKNEVLLVILHADKIPPHLGWITDGKFFSAKARSADIDVPVESVFNIIDTKNITTLCYQLDAKYFRTNEWLIDLFSAYKNGLPVHQTCLMPLLEIVQPDCNCSTISDLIQYLEKENAIIQSYSLHTSDDFNGLPTYSKKDIIERINFLKHGAR